MNIGYGVTVWDKGIQRGHFDGIGVYTRELFHALQPLLTDQTTLLPMGFGVSEHIEGLRSHVLAPQYEQHVMKAILLRNRISCRKHEPMPALFHATDHHIPMLKEVPVVATLMDIIPFLHPEWVSTGRRAIKNWFFKQVITSADHLITISEHSKRDIVRYFGFPEQHISVTPLGVNQRYFETVPDEYKAQVLAQHGLKPGFFLFIGTLQPRKNLNTLLDAHACLPATLQKKHPLVVVGQLGWNVDGLLKRVEHLAHEGKVTWLKFLPQDQVHALLQAAQALVFVSLYEGFGLPVLEAFAAHCPVIASDSTSIPEVAGDAACLVNPTDKRAISDAMIQLIKAQDYREALIEKGVERATLYSWDRCARNTLGVYKKFL
jgi:glycosyltransferase involved in cell wall biosynthesis